MVDVFLEQLTKVSKEDDQLDVISNFLDLCNEVDVKYIVKLIHHDLKINIGPKFVLNAIHPKAFKGININ